MSTANATQVMAGVQANLAPLFPKLANSIRIRKGIPGPHPESPLCGWVTTDPCPAIIISCPDEDEIDEYGTFEDISVQYAVRIDYVKPIPGGADPRKDDDDIRQFRQQVRDNLYKPTLLGVPIVWDTHFKAAIPYTPEAGGTPVVSVSSEVCIFTTSEDRPYNTVS